MAEGEELSEDQQTKALTIMTTEHFALQGARSATISEAVGRTTLFLSSVSSALVALAFIGQVSAIGQAFLLFAGVLLPILFFLGVVTFARVLQSAMEDMLYVRGMNRIRHLYVELVPALRPYFVLSTFDDAQGARQSMTVQQGPWQMLLTTAGMVGVINSVLGAVFLGLMASGLLGYSLVVALLLAVIAFALSLALHIRYQFAQWQALEQRLDARFPNPAAQRETRQR